LSRRSSAPSRTAVSGVFNSCETCRRKRVCCCSSSERRVRSQSRRWPEVAEVLRPVDLHRLREVGAAHPANREIELANGACDEDREDERERKRDGDGGEREPQPLLTALRRRLLQALDGALGELRGRIEHALRVLDERGVAVGELRDLRRRPIARAEELPQLVLLLAKRVRLASCAGSERQQRQLLRRLLVLVRMRP
jgi:hypothetical protein